MPHALRVLIVDDHPEARALVRLELERTLPGCDVIEAGDEPGFARALESQRFGVVITEWQLAWSDGIDVFRRVTACAPECPVVVCTSHGSEHAAAEALKAGFADYVVKSPAELWRLAPAVRHARQHAARTAARRLAEERTAFLADVTSLLASSLDVEALVRELARVVVPGLADYCFVDLVAEDGGIRRVAAHHGGQEAHGVPSAAGCGGAPVDANRGLGASVIFRGEPAYVRVVDEDSLRRLAADVPELDLVRRLRTTSFVGVPLIARDRTLGALSLAYASSGRHYTPGDVVFAEDLARRAGLAIDNARLYRDSERARAEIARLTTDLQRRVDELQTLLDVIPIGIGIADDPECRRIRVNPAFARSLSIGIDENASLSAPDAERPAFRVVRDGAPVAPDDLPMQYAARTGREVRDIELDVQHPDGTRVTLYEYASPLFDEHGRVRGAVGAFLDITARKRAEERLRLLERASVALNASLDFDETVTQVAALVVPFLADWCAIDLVDADGRLVRRGAAHAEPGHDVSLRSHEAAFPFLDASPFHPSRIILDKRPQVTRAVTRTWLEQHVACVHLAAASAYGLSSVLVTPLLGKHRALGALSLFSRQPRYRDDDVALAEELSLRLALALDNARLYEEAREANRLRDEFLATVSHELRTPLNAMLGWAHLLRTGALSAETTTRALEAIERNATAQTLLIDDLLDVARVVSGKLRLSPDTVDLPALVRSAVDAFRPAATAKRLTLALHFTGSVSSIAGDGDRLRQVCWNLLSNAVKFTPEDGRVDVEVRREADSVEIAVRDTGVGISPAFLPHLFERFRQADASTTRQHGGLGLGLSIVRHLVELHGGRVRAESRGLGHGAVFTVVLPTSRADGPPPFRPVAVAGRLAVSGSQGLLAGTRLLAVDDESDARELLHAILTAAGARVTVAASGAEAFAAFRREPPDALVADLGLPDEDGYALLRRIRALPPADGGTAPAIALTAFARGSDRAESLAAGFDLHLTKPVDPDELCAAVADLVASRRIG